jgi:tRNA(Ile)-lysidine synthase
MLQKIKETIEKFNMLQPKDNVLVAVSGGVDSVALLHALYELKGELEISLAIAHLDHQIRGKESKEDAEFVLKLAGKLKLPLVKESFDVPSYAKEHGLSIEEGAREVRYRFLKESAATIKADKIALGHNLNDHVETFLMNLIRGAGVEGLSGIPPVRDIYIRPLIECTRKEILEFASIKNLKYRQDRTNIEMKHTRNRIRHELLPLLGEYNPNILNTIAHTASILRETAEFLDHEASVAFKETVIKEDKEMITLKLKLKELPKIIKEHLIRKAIGRVKGGLRGIEYVHLQEISKELEKERSALDLPGGIRFVLKEGKISFISQKEVKLPPYEFTLSLGENILAEIGWRFHLDVVDKKQISLNSLLTGLEYVDYDKIKWPMVVRSRRIGDRFRPLGMKGTKKLKDFFIDVKVPLQQRDHIPLIADSKGIIWVVGLRLSDDYKVTPKTKRVLEIVASKIKG